MSIYDILMSPLEKRILGDLRRSLIPRARGQVLEIGVGTGVNFPNYDWQKITAFTALDLQVDPAARHRAPALVRFLAGTAERLPFADGSLDTVVATLVFCTVPDLPTTLAEIRRVLKTDGSLLFIDHVLPEDKKMAALFRTANRVWPHLAHGCNLTRGIHREIAAAGFSIAPAGSAAHQIFRWGVARPLIIGSNPENDDAQAKGR